MLCPVFNYSLKEIKTFIPWIILHFAVPVYEVKVSLPMFSLMSLIINVLARKKKAFSLKKYDVSQIVINSVFKTCTQYFRAIIKFSAACSK